MKLRPFHSPGFWITIKRYSLSEREKKLLYFYTNLYFFSSVKDLYNTDLQKKIVIQTHWNLSSIYNKVYSLILANKIDSPREYFRVWYLQSGMTKWNIEVEYFVSSRK